jgi:SAM-dependent methyltransferase
MIMTFANSSYSRHEAQLRDEGSNFDVSAFDNDGTTADNWRHLRMYEAVNAFLHHPDWTWLTVGDGTGGLDSIRIRRMGIRRAVPSDISPYLLELSRSKGHIDEFHIENAEQLSFEDGSFDVVFCKEAYHHFPRPAIALYEMLRVSRKAVILIEPRDYLIDRPKQRSIGPRGWLRECLRWLCGRLGIDSGPIPVSQRYLLGDPPHYETSGNYMYTISSREMEKIALGLDLPAMAVKGLNDCYIPEAGSEPATDESAIFQKMTHYTTKSSNVTH